MANLCISSVWTDLPISLVHSFIQVISIAPLKSTTTQRRSRHNTVTVSEFRDETSQATASEGHTQGPYVAARAGFEPATVRTKGVESTNETPRPTNINPPSVWADLRISSL